MNLTFANQLASRKRAQAQQTFFYRFFSTWLGGVEEGVQVEVPEFHVTLGGLKGGLLHGWVFYQKNQSSWGVGRNVHLRSMAGGAGKPSLCLKNPR